MGKTIQIIALFVTDNIRPNLVVAYGIFIFRPGCLADLYASPTVAIMQWRNELATHTDGMKVLVWHGASREWDVKELKKYDVVLSSPLDQYCIKSNDNIGFDNICCHGKVLYFYQSTPRACSYTTNSCFRKQESGFKRKGMIVKEKSPLHKIEWHRIVVRVAGAYT